MKNNEGKDHQQGDSGGSSRRDGGPSKNRRYRILETFLQNQAPLRRFISRYLISTHDIEDIAQEAFLRAYEAEKKKRIDEPKAFLFRIAKNLLLSEYSKKSRKITDYIADFEYTEVLLDNESLEANVMAQQKLGIFCEAVATLPPQCRRVFLLKKVYGMSHKEIAEHMGIAVSTIEKHLVKGIRQCNSVIAERYGDEISPGRTAERSPSESSREKGRIK